MTKEYCYHEGKKYSYNGKYYVSKQGEALIVLRDNSVTYASHKWAVEYRLRAYIPKENKKLKDIVLND